MGRKKNRLNKAYEEIERRCFLEEINIPDEFVEWQLHFYSKQSALNEFSRWFKFKKANRHFNTVINTEKEPSYLRESFEPYAPQKSSFTSKFSAIWEEQWDDYYYGTNFEYKNFASVSNKLAIPEPFGLSGVKHVCF